MNIVWMLHPLRFAFGEDLCQAQAILGADPETDSFGGASSNTFLEVFWAICPNPTHKPPIPDILMLSAPMAPPGPRVLPTWRCSAPWARARGTRVTRQAE